MTMRKRGVFAFLHIELLESWACNMIPVIKNPLANAGDTRDSGSIPGSGRCPGGGKGQHPTPVSLPRESHAQRSLAGYRPCVPRDWTWLITQAHTWRWVWGQTAPGWDQELSSARPLPGVSMAPQLVPVQTLLGLDNGFSLVFFFLLGHKFQQSRCNIVSYLLALDRGAPIVGSPDVRPKVSYKRRDLALLVCRELISTATARGETWTHSQGCKTKYVPSSIVDESEIQEHF